MDQSGITQNRRSRRSNVYLAASVCAGGVETAVKLRNLSGEGALIEGDQLPTEGAEVLFKRNELEVRGRLVWVSGSQAGIAFARKLQPEQVLRHVPQPKARAMPDFRRPGLACREMSPIEKKLVESWALTATRATRPGD